MKSMWRAVGPSFAIGVLAMVACAGAIGAEMTAEANDVVLAEFRWGGEQHQITVGQLEREVSELPDYRKDDYEGRSGRQEYLTLMAESRILLERAQELKLADDPEINAKVDEYRVDQMLEAVKDREIDDKVSVTDADVEAYYLENRDEKYGLPEQIRLICVTMADRKEAAAALLSVTSGERTLEDVAKELSEARKNLGPGSGRAGDTGLFGQGTYSEVVGFEEAAFAFDVGDLTPEVLEVDRMGRKYYMFFRLEERSPPRIQNLDEVRRAVERAVRRDKEAAREAAWNEELRSIAGCMVYEDQVPATPEAPATSETEAAPKDDEVTMPDTVDVAAVLAEYTWGGTAYTYTYGDLKQAFEELFVYRRTRYKTHEDWVRLLNEDLQERLRLLEAGDLGFGSTDAELQTFKEYRHQLMVEALVKKEVDQMVEVTDDQLQAYYNEHQDEYMDDEKVRLTCLSFTDREDAEKWFEEIKGGRDILEAGATLSEMGKNVGPGMRNNGDTGLFQRAQYDSAAAFVDAAFSLKVGEFTPEIVVQEMSNATYYIMFRVEEKAPPRLKTLDEVRTRVSSAVERINKRERLDVWLAQLKDRSNLTVYPERVPEDAGAEEETNADG